MANRQFCERLNKELDDIGLPQNSMERVDALAKLLKIPRFQAELLLNGNKKPTDPLISALADELEVQAEWLVGTKVQKKHS